MLCTFDIQTASSVLSSDRVDDLDRSNLRRRISFLWDLCTCSCIVSEPRSWPFVGHLGCFSCFNCEALPPCKQPKKQKHKILPATFKPVLTWFRCCNHNAETITRHWRALRSLPAHNGWYMLEKKASCYARVTNKEVYKQAINQAPFRPPCRPSV